MFLKAAMDAAQKAGIIGNDSQVRDARVRLLPAEETGWWGTSVRFAPFGEDGSAVGIFGG